MGKHGKKLIGSTDVIDLPEFGLENIECKIDTGAATSSLHCRDLQLRRENGEEVLHFRLYDPEFNILSKELYRFSEFKIRRVRSSNGQTEKRYTIKTPVEIMGRKIKTEFTLSFREKMRYPVLLGKRFLKNRFIVDVSLDHLNLKLKQQR